MAEGDENPEKQTQVSSQKQESKGPWYSAPERLGNTAGETIQNAFKPVGQPLGKGLETVAKPVGGIIDPLVGGIMRAGQAHENQFKDGGFSEAQKGPLREEKSKVGEAKPTGGQEQTAENPLGLSGE